MVETLKKEGNFTLRGDPDESAVLCTSSKTFSVKKCSTSNSLLLTPDLSVSNSPSDEILSKSVVSTNFDYYELKLVGGKLDKLRNQLMITGFRGEEYESEMESKMLTWDDILQTVQASENEIRHRLDELGAFELGGHWRLLDHEYKTSAMSRILTLLEEKLWSWEKVPLIETCKMLEDLQPLFVTEICLRLYGIQVSDSETDVFIKLCQDKVSRFYGEYILSSTEGRFNLNEFLEVWQDSLPEGMICDVKHLTGLIMIDKSSPNHTITYLPVSSLPINPADRFAALFTRKEKWAHDEITPYLEDLAGPGQTVNALLLKYCRCSTDHVTKTKTYNSKVRM